MNHYEWCVGLGDAMGEDLAGVPQILPRDDFPSPLPFSFVSRAGRDTA